MSFGVPPFGKDGVEPDGRRDEVQPKGVLGRLKRHLRTWPQRYVQMRIDAVSERHDV